MRNRRELVEINKDLVNVSGLPVLFHKRSNTLIMADLHLGYEDYMATLGVFLPRVQLKVALDTVEEALSAIGNKLRLVIAGDIKHVFEKLTRQERIETIKFVNNILSLGNVKELILVRGNHDTFVAPLLKKLNVEIVEDHLYLDERTVIAHGHKSPKCECETIIIGHEHASILVDVGGARTKLPVMLRVPLEDEDDKEVYVLPPTGVYQTGNNVSLERSSYLSPIIRDRGIVKESMVWIVDRDYGTVKLAELKYVIEAALL